MSNVRRAGSVETMSPLPASKSLWRLSASGRPHFLVSPCSAEKAIIAKKSLTSGARHRSTSVVSKTS